MHDPITYFQAIILGLVQGVAEPFPISSLGHGVILPRLAGWNIHQNDKFFITFLVATHLATAIVLFGFFFGDWVRIFKGMGRSLRDRVIAPKTTTRAWAGCWWSERSRSGSSACCSRIRCARLRLGGVGRGVPGASTGSPCWSSSGCASVRRRAADDHGANRRRARRALVAPGRR